MLFGHTLSAPTMRISTPELPGGRARIEAPLERRARSS